MPTAVEAMKVGAFDYLLKPFKLQSVLPVLTRALEVRRLRVDNRRLRTYVDRLAFEAPQYRLVGSSPALQKVIQLIEKVAPTGATVLVRGASGTGKELVARALHFNSPRKDKPLVTINCAALQETLLESELFGHEKGAFTGATQAKAGLIEVAEGGTLFIDEVAEMAPGLQAKLLRVLGGRPLPPGRRDAGTARRRAGHRRHEQAAGGRAEGRPVPRGSVLPPQRRGRHAAAAARSAGGHPRAGRAFSGDPPGRPGARGASARRRCSC